MLQVSYKKYKYNVLRSQRMKILLLIGTKVKGSKLRLEHVKMNGGSAFQVEGMSLNKDLELRKYRIHMRRM